MNQKSFINYINKHARQKATLPPAHILNFFDDPNKYKIMDKLTIVDRQLRELANTNLIYHKTNSVNVESILNEKALKPQIEVYQGVQGYTEHRHMQLVANYHWRMAMQCINREKQQLHLERQAILEELSTTNLEPRIYFSDYMEYGYDTAAQFYKDKNIIFIYDQEQLKKYLKRNIAYTESEIIDDEIISFHCGVTPTLYSFKEDSPQYIYDFMDKVNAEFNNIEFLSYESIPNDLIKYVLIIKKGCHIDVFKKNDDTYKKIKI